ncbi:MAG: GGDEF domain-containing protein [Sphaerochaetaceae bacterium]
MNPLIIINLFSMVPLFFTIYLNKRHLSGNIQNRYYILASYITLVLLSLEVVSHSLVNHTSALAMVMHLLANAIYFILMPFVVLLILWYLGYSDFETKTKRLLVSPLVLNALIAILSIQNGWYFTISTTNEYIRGPYFYVTTCLIFFYYIQIPLQLYKMRKETISPSKVLMIMVYFLPIIATILQFFHLNISYITSSTAASLLLYYLIVQEAKFDYDLPTKARNRIAFEREIVAQHAKSQEIGLFLFDMNNLKRVNDTWGHQEGDYLLVILAQLLSQTFAPEGKVFRIGGDEFCVLLPVPRKQKIDAQMEHFERRVQESNERLAHQLDVAWGYAETSKQKGITSEDAFILADEAMYRHKALLKQSKLP